VRFFHIGNIECGKNTVINFGCYLDNRRKIIIGNNVGIAHNTKIYTLGHDINDPQLKIKGKNVIIKDNVFIFSNVLIMPGVTIGEGAIILAGSVVINNVEPFTVVGGNPAEFIKTRSGNIEYKIDYNYWFAL
jgi:maltose O-acetyltransferase